MKIWPHETENSLPYQEILTPKEFVIVIAMVVVNISWVLLCTSHSVCTCVILFKLHNKPMKTRREKSNVDELVGL